MQMEQFSKCYVISCTEIMCLVRVVFEIVMEHSVLYIFIFNLLIYRLYLENCGQEVLGTGVLTLSSYSESRPDNVCSINNILGLSQNLCN
jgi:hypothetical protein